MIFDEKKLQNKNSNKIKHNSKNRGEAGDPAYSMSLM
jgi:hypothetical protein